MVAVLGRMGGRARYEWRSDTWRSARALRRRISGAGVFTVLFWAGLLAKLGRVW